MNDRSSYQNRVIRNYYRQRGAIAEQRAQELITELYLTSGKKREKNWEHLVSHLKALGMPPKQIDHLRAQDNPELVARAVQKLSS
jgi:hypothetical protein